MSLGDVTSIILTVMASLTLVYIARQVQVARQQAKGQFILALDEQLAASREIGARLATEPQFRPEGAEWPRVWALMSVFERINIMVDDKILDVALVDRLYGFYLIRILENDTIYQRLHATGADWQDFVRLCHGVARLRRRRNHEHDRVFLERVATLDTDARRMSNPFSY